MTPLSTQDLAFLNANYVVHDPLKKTTSKDFSQLSNCKVLLIGEIPNCSNLQQNAERLLHITTTGKSCLLVEHLAPGIVVDASRIELYKNLPAHLKVQGGDVQGLSDFAQFSILKGLLHELSRAKDAYARAYGNELTRVAERLNSLWRSGSLQIEERKMRVAPIPWEEVEQFCSANHLTNLEGEYKRVFQNHPHFTKPLHRSSLMTCVDGLKEEINKASRVFERVIVVWESLYLVGNDYLLTCLRNREVIVLLPDPKLTNDFLCKSPDELEAAKDLTVRFEKFGISPRSQREMRVHKKFLRTLLPGLLSAVSCTTESSIFITPQAWIEQVEGNNNLVLAPHLQYTFIGVDFLFAAKLSDKIHSENRISSTLFKQLFSRFMFKQGLSIVNAYFGDGQFELNLYVRNEQTCLGILSAEEVFLEFTTDYYSIDVYYFLNTAADGGFTLQPGKRLVMTMICTEDRGFLKNGSESMEVVLTKYVPDGQKVRIEGSYSFEVNKDVVFYANDTVKFRIEPII